MRKPNDDELYTLEQAAVIIGKPVGTINHWCRVGLIPMRRGSRGRGIPRLLDEVGLLAAMATKTLFQSGAPSSVIATAAAFLGRHTRSALEAELTAGRCVLVVSPGRAMLCPPNGHVLNVGPDVLIAAVDLVALMARIAWQIDHMNELKEVASANQKKCLSSGAVLRCSGKRKNKHHE